MGEGGGGGVSDHVTLAIKGQSLTKHLVSYLPPLIVGVDIPDNALTKYLVFVHGCIVKH